MTERIVTYRLLREERETLYRYSDGDTYVICDTTIPKDIRKLTAKGWIMESCDKTADGTIVAARFRSPINTLSIRSYVPSKPKRKLSDEHREKLINSRKNQFKSE